MGPGSPYRVGTESLDLEFDMRSLKILGVAAAAALFVFGSGQVMAKKAPAPAKTGEPKPGKYAKPAKGTVAHFFIDSMSLIRDGKWDKWVSNYCHTEAQCYNRQAVRRIKQYNLPAIQRRMKKDKTTCLPGAGDTIEFTRVMPYESKGLKGWQVYIKCGVSMPWPWYVIKDKDGKFKSPKI